MHYLDNIRIIYKGFKVQDFSFFDIAVIAITVLLGLKGLFRGLIKEAFGLIGIVGGIFIASRASKDIGDLIAPILALESDSSIKLIGFVAGLIGFWVIVYIIGMILSKMSSMSGLGTFDRILGFVFGSGKIFLILSIIVYALSQVNAFKEKLETNFGSTITYPILLDTGAYIIKLDTAGITSKIEEGIDSAVITSKEVIEETTKKTIQEQAQEAVESVKESATEIANEVQEKVQQSVDTVKVETEKVVDKEIKEAKEEIK